MNKLLVLCVLSVSMTILSFGDERSGKNTLTKIGDIKKLCLVNRSKATMPIVISAKADSDIQLVAKELAEYLGRISGAKFKINRVSLLPKSGIILGTLEQFPQPDDPAIAKGLKIRNNYDGKEAYVIRTKPQKLLLLGSTGLGASHAAYRLLKYLGCRWFFPNLVWEVLPKSDSIYVNINEIDRPVIPARRIWYQWGGAFDKQAKKDYIDWSRRNNNTSSIKINCGHAWDGIIRRNKELFENHPEYLALFVSKDGKNNRGGNKFCISNPDLVELCQKDTLSILSKHPDMEMISMDPSDGGGHCQCKACKKMGKISNRVFYLANEVAKVVAQQYPGKMVGLYAYNFHSEPPDFKLNNNVYIQITNGFIQGQYSFEELMKLWPKKCSNIGYYEYFSVYQWNWDMPPGGRGANISFISRQIPIYATYKAASIDAESGCNWGLNGRGYIVANRLMWNPGTNVDVILDDFYHKAFGPVAEIMKKYYERLDPGNGPLMSSHLLGEAYRDIAKASKLAANRPDVLARLDHLKIYLRYVHLRWKLNMTKDTEQKKKLTIAILTHVYRTRHSYMNHWDAMRQFWTPRAAKEFKDNSLYWKWKPEKQTNKIVTTNPWRLENSYSRQEIDHFFKEGLRFFKPVRNIKKIKFSENLLPVQFQSNSDNRKQYRTGFCQGYRRVALYSITGEPIVLSVLTGTIAHYRNRPDASYNIIDKKGKVISKGKFPIDGEKHKITAEVPKKGLYLLDFHDSGAGWSFVDIDTDLPLTLRPNPKRQDLKTPYSTRSYFYVPKKSKYIQYYYKSTGSHNLELLNNKKIFVSGPVQGKIFSIPVPEGEDGKLWHFRTNGSGCLKFLNIPNVLSFSKNGLMLPKEVVEKDNLKLH